ncbi:NADH:flavorubredoxin reductase NorW [Vibrio mediterranei]|uniref:NADH:flavorubredoxin reductase NorW n=1 Tax=Vibrio mediterranei TaxID=689 RepID=UPI00228378EB|nr:NADH:flavorubredoxin reductase NorW [Vibrio mediterranei]MCY9852456.1 NADH:flavorubredoxin reductase NorW [Vibrio mediterranei]
MKQFDIVIVGSGFAAYQLVKSLRRIDNSVSVAVVTGDDGHDYNKPDLSHVFTKKQTAEQVITKRAESFAQEYGISLYTNTWVEHVDPQLQILEMEGESLGFAKLVLATGASPFIPVFKGSASQDFLTHNSLIDYEKNQTRWRNASRILVLGGGLIGVEVALDLASVGKQVFLVEPATRLMQNQLPDYIELKLKQALQQESIKVVTDAFVTHIDEGPEAKLVTLNQGQELMVDEILVCAGLRANTVLAKDMGLEVNKGIIVDDYLCTSTANIFALGDCAEIQGEVRAFLQPIVMSASALAKTLTGDATKLTLPTMLTKVKTPNYPIQFAGVVHDKQVTRWNYDASTNGILATAFNDNDDMIGFIATRGRAPESFKLLRELV